MCRSKKYEGICKGEITSFYDPMIAKVTTWGLNRDGAIARMRRALDEFYIQGVNHNIGFLTALLAHPRFLAGRLSTNFIAEEYPEGFRPAPLEDRDLNAFIGAAAFMRLRYMERAARTSGQMPGYPFQIPRHREVGINHTYYPVTIQPTPGGFDVTRDDGHVLAVRSDWPIGDAVLRCTINARPQHFKVEREGFSYMLFHQGAEVKVEVYPSTAVRLAKLMPVRVPPDRSMYLVSPMTGLLRSIAVEEGEEVVPGQALGTVEAMKMENVLRSKRAAKVATIKAKPGDTLTVGQVILEFERGSAQSTSS